MRVRVTVTVEVDTESWMLAYGLEKGEVREDVKRYVALSVEGAEDAPITVRDWH